MEKSLPPIPPKRYFTIGEVSDLCRVKPYVLRYWEQEFAQLKPIKRRGNRRYYQQHEVLLIRRIRELLYDQGFTINGARNRLAEAMASARQPGMAEVAVDVDMEAADDVVDDFEIADQAVEAATPPWEAPAVPARASAGPAQRCGAQLGLRRSAGPAVRAAVDPRPAERLKRRQPAGCTVYSAAQSGRSAAW